MAPLGAGCLFIARVMNRHPQRERKTGPITRIAEAVARAAGSVVFRSGGPHRLDGPRPFRFQAREHSLGRAPCYRRSGGDSSNWWLGWVLHRLGHWVIYDSFSKRISNLLPLMYFSFVPPIYFSFILDITGCVMRFLECPLHDRDCLFRSPRLCYKLDFPYLFVYIM